MRTRLTIGQLAEQAGVPTSTVRYYERAHLLEPDDRTEGNYRVYSVDALERLRFIRVAQAAGFSLEDISILLGIRDGDTACCEDVEPLIERRLGDVRGRLKDLREVESHLKRLLEICRGTQQKDHCEALDRLTEDSSKL